jgi:flagellar basal-body rod protein FlgC
MSFMPNFDITASALSAERLRMDVTSGNLANTQTTRGPDGQPYRKLMPVFEAQPIEFEDTLSGELNLQLSKVAVTGIEKDARPPKRVYDPGHPDADKDGYVSLPNINVMEEMADLMMASRTYEANVTAFNTSKQMVLKTLDIGRV